MFRALRFDERVVRGDGTCLFVADCLHVLASSSFARVQNSRVGLQGVEIVWLLGGMRAPALGVGGLVTHTEGLGGRGMRLFKRAAGAALALAFVTGCGDSGAAPASRCLSTECLAPMNDCLSDADCGTQEFCAVRLTERNTCEPVVDEPISCDGSLIVWEVSVTEDIPIGDGVLVNELQLRSVDVRASVTNATPPTSVQLDDVPLPYAPEEPLRVPFTDGDNFSLEIDVEHPEDRFRTFPCAFSYTDMLASPGSIACALPVDDDVVLATDPIPTVYAKLSYDIPNECGVVTNQPGLFQIAEIRAFELIDHPETGPGTPRQYGTVDATLTVDATKTDPRSIEGEIPFTPAETVDVPLTGTVRCRSARRSTSRPETPAWRARSISLRLCGAGLASRGATSARTTLSSRTRKRSVTKAWFVASMQTIRT